MQLWRLENPKSAELMSQLESEGQKASAKAGKPEVLFKNRQAGEFSFSGEGQPFPHSDLQLIG